MSTHRSPDGAFAGTGAVRQHDGKLPIYVCDTCGSDVVWATSSRTGKKYLAAVCFGYMGQRFYVGRPHRCDARDARPIWSAKSAAEHELHRRDQAEIDAADAYDAFERDRERFADDEYQAFLEAESDEFNATWAVFQERARADRARAGSRSGVEQPMT